MATASLMEATDVDAPPRHASDDGDAREKAYLLARMEASLAMAGKSGNAAVKLIHLELAGRYSVAASRHEQAGLAIDPTTGRSDHG